jgi:hypothetical protein
MALTAHAACSGLPQEIHMNDKLPLNPTTDADDQDKGHTPDKLRNDDATWTSKDMPEQKKGAVPEDYERVPTDR